MPAAEKPKGGKPAGEEKPNEKPNESTEETDEAGSDVENEGGEESGSDDKAKKTISVEEFEAFKKKSNEENAKLRHKLKEQKQAATKSKEEKGDEPDPVSIAKKEFEAKQRNSLIRAELAAVAKDAHDPAAVLKLAPNLFKDIDVDFDDETVDREALEEAVEAARKSHPYLFAAKKESNGNNEETLVGKKISDKGRSGGGGNHYSKWKDLQKTDPKAANQYYVKNRAEILAQMKTSG